MGPTAKDMDALVSRGYEHGFVTEIETDVIPPGLSEDVIRQISLLKNEPHWVLDYRLKAYRHWLTMTPPAWASVHYPPIDHQAISYFAAPKKKPTLDSLDDVDPELLRTYEKLGIPIEEQKALAGVAVDAVFDSVSVATTFRENLAEAGVIFCSISEAMHDHAELLQQYLGSVVPHTDNYYAALNAAVFTDGTFVYVPKGV
ncbi:MAG: Fe-S cluster assembly protein SufB, partial [Gammaproteobacteria bacterium]|nr:Fe-S cluster assembly protein SufB [Gammaproteobacteria bacterium]